MDDHGIADVVAALDQIAKILAGVLLRDLEDEDQARKIARLRQCGFTNQEIAKMLGTTANTVGVQVHKLKSKKKPGKKRRVIGA